MSDSFDFTNIYNVKFKKAKFILPLHYLKDILNGLKKIFFGENLIDLKNSPLNLYDRLFGSESRRYMLNVLVLIADLESNVGAACIELLNNEGQDSLKGLNYRSNVSYNDELLYYDESYYMYSFDTQISNENIYDPNIDNITDDIKEESKVLEANLYSEETIEKQFNPNYLMQISLSSDNSTLHKDNLCEDSEIQREQYDSLNSIDHMKSLDWNSLDASSFTEASTGNSCEESGDKENDYSDCESISSSDKYDNESHNYNISSLPKPIKREIYQLKMLGVPFDYFDITQSSHDAFKAMKSKPDLTKTQLSAMTNARRRFINRRAATRCRTQKLQQKDQLKLELKKLQNQLLQTKLTLTKAYQQRNEMRDQYRIVQQNLVYRLQGPNQEALNPKRWSTELKDNKSLVLIENIRSS